METLLLRHTSGLVDLSALADASVVRSNPHKGWYLHYYDNALTKYGASLSAHDRLLDFPGLATVYLRVPWCELEPEEGRFAWHVLDQVIDTWLPTGRTIAFCVSCKETNPHYVFATPRWVRDAGAKGAFIRRADGSDGNWEPDYGDVIFLSKLEAFHHAFATRYDGRPWVEWVTVGSYGDWGEGHTCASSRRDWPLAVIRRHLDLYRSCYRLSRIEVNDDLVGSRFDRASAEELRRYIDECGFALTDHGVSVDWFARNFGPSTLRDAAWLRRASERGPIVLELEHYHLTVKHGNWRGGEPLRLAIEEARASFAGFHGCGRTWLRDNPEYARTTANRLGYWLFPREVSLPLKLRRGEPLRLAITWENRGVAPVYHAADLMVRLQPVSGGAAWTSPVREVGAKETPSGRVARVEGMAVPPAELAAGEHEVSFALIDRRLARPIRLAVRDSALSADGFHHLPGARILVS